MRFLFTLLYFRRGFAALGFDEYIEGYADGLQILRYNLTKAYNKHMDWISGNDQLKHDYDSGGKGGNRFATILLYMSEHGERGGGETVFTKGWPLGQAAEDRVDLNQVGTEIMMCPMMPQNFPLITLKRCKDDYDHSHWQLIITPFIEI